MGQKVHPRGIRLGISADWRAHWYAHPREYANRVRIDLLARSYIEKELKSAGVSDIFIAFTTKSAAVNSDGVSQRLANITAHVARPGIVIGRKGGTVERMRKELEMLTGIPVYLSIQEVRRPELNAKLVAENIAHQLVRRVNHRRAIKKAEDTAMRMGALGIKVIVSGRLGGTEIARRETAQRGSVPLHTFSKLIDYAQATAQTSSGKIGVVVYVHTKPYDPKTPAVQSNRMESDARRMRLDRNRSAKHSARKDEAESSQTRY